MAQSLVFLVAGTIFIASVGTILFVTSSQPADGGDAQQAVLDNQATSLLDVLQGAKGGGDPDDPLPGLGGGSGLDPGLLDTLKGGRLGEEPDNGLSDYEEQRRALGLTERGIQYNLRILPMEDPDTNKSDLKVGLIANTPIPSTDDLRVPYVFGLLPEQAKEQVNAEFNAVAPTNTEMERTILKELGYDYDNQINFATDDLGATWELVPGVPTPFSLAMTIPELRGDVFPAKCSYLDATIPAYLSQYDALVIGTDVDAKTELNGCGDVPDTIASWVDAGGMLVVMGSEASDAAWLSPTLTDCLSTADNSPYMPDPHHVLLHRPNKLADIDLDDANAMQDLEDHWDCFNHLILEPGTVEGQPDPYSGIAVSKLGALDQGHAAIVASRTVGGYAVTPDSEETSDDGLCFTEVTDCDLATTPADPEVQAFSTAKDLMENILHYVLTSAETFITYGPSVPTDATVGYATRLCEYPDDNGEQVVCRMEVRAWKE